jgi:N-acetylneuraminic acid mutarotase
MFTYLHRAALCSVGLSVMACGDQVTEPETTRLSVTSSPLLSGEVPGIWRKTPQILPARSDMSAAVLDKSIVVVGGATRQQPAGTARVDAYNVATKAWTPLAPLPEPRIRHGATTINGKIYVAGGVGPPVNAGALQPKKSLFVYDPATNTWGRKADMPGPVYISLQANLSGRLYVYALGNDFTPDYFLAYSPGADKWVRLPLPPSRHFGGVMTALDGKLYLTDGLTRARVNPYNLQLDVYDPGTRSWTVRSPMMLYGGNTGTVAGTLHGKLWVAGTPSEFVTDSTGSHYLSNRGVQVYDPIADEWKYGPLMLRNSRNGAAAVAGGKLYVIGGRDLGELTSMVQALSTSY